MTECTDLTGHLAGTDHRWQDCPTYRDSEPTSDRCATPGCDEPARWYSIPEGNRYGNRAPRRCAECCDTIANAGAVTDEQIAHALTGPTAYVVVDGNAYSLDDAVELVHTPLAADGTPVWGDSALVDPRAMDREHMREIRDGIGALTEAVRRIHGYA